MLSVKSKLKVTTTLNIGVPDRPPQVSYLYQVLAHHKYHMCCPRALIH